MEIFPNLVIFLAAYLIGLCTWNVHGGTEEEAQAWLIEADKRFSANCNRKSQLEWQVNIDLDDKNLTKALDEELEKFSTMNTEFQMEVLNNFGNWREFKNKTLRRALKSLAVGGAANMSLEHRQAWSMIGDDMATAYNKATVCKYDNRSDCSMTLKEIEARMEESMDSKELEYYWTAWHDKMSDYVRPEMYRMFVEFMTEFANANGCKSEPCTWLSGYDDDTDDWTYEKFQKEIFALMDEITPMYKIFHAYVRMKMRKRPEFKGLVDKCSYIPVHITGSMWAQEWAKLDKLTKPFPNAPTMDATDALVKEGYTPKRMYEEADKFFKEMGLKGVSAKFWENSVIEKPPDKEIACHPQAWDICSEERDDFRIRMCTKVNQKDLYMLHHEMGHIEYFQAYSKWPFVFRGGANMGFHEVCNQK